jgi:hypothetical protein
MQELRGKMRSLAGLSERARVKQNLAQMRWDKNDKPAAAKRHKNKNAAEGVNKLRKPSDFGWRSASALR